MFTSVMLTSCTQSCKPYEARKGIFDGSDFSGLNGCMGSVFISGQLLQVSAVVIKARTNHDLACVIRTFIEIILSERHNIYLMPPIYYHNLYLLLYLTFILEELYSDGHKFTQT